MLQLVAMFILITKQRQGLFSALKLNGKIAARSFDLSLLTSKIGWPHAKCLKRMISGPDYLLKYRCESVGWTRLK